MKKMFTLLLSFSSLLALSQPTYSWLKGFGGSGNDQTTCVTTDASGNVYVCGYFTGTVDFDPSASTYMLTSTGNIDAFFAKFSDAGNLVWAKSFGSTTGDAANRIVLDNLNNIYLTGSFSGTADFDPSVAVESRASNGSNDIFIAKFDQNGNYLNVTTVGGTGDDYASSIAIDNSSALIITGYFTGTVDFDPSAAIANRTSLGGVDSYVAKYDIYGNFFWANSSVNNSTGNESGASIAVDGDGNVAYIGITRDVLNNVDVMSMAKYDELGTLIFNFKTAPAAAGVGNKSYGYDLAFDDVGNILTTGTYVGSIDFSHDASGSTYVAGSSFNTYVAKYTSNGVLSYFKQISGATGGNDAGRSIKLDASNNIYITGGFEGTVDFDFNNSNSAAILTSQLNTKDVFIAKYDSSANFVWCVSGGGNNNDYGISLALDNTDNIYSTGYYELTSMSFGSGTSSLSNNGSFDAFIIKYDQGNVTNLASVKTNVGAFSVFPNPTSSEFTIQSQKADVINVTNELGQVIETVELNQQNNYSYKVRNLAVGMYFLNGSTIKHKVVVAQ